MNDPLWGGWRNYALAAPFLFGTTAISVYGRLGFVPSTLELEAPCEALAEGVRSTLTDSREPPSRTLKKNSD